MNKVSSTELLFYQKVGELFYAVAASDRIIHATEYNVLKELVAEEWKSIDNKKDVLPIMVANQISVILEWFDYERMDADDCFESFQTYYNDHNNFFSEKRKKRILQTGRKIAGTFNESSTKGLKMMSSLQLLFNQE